MALFRLSSSDGHWWLQPVEPDAAQAWVKNGATVVELEGEALVRYTAHRAECQYWDQLFTAKDNEAYAIRHTAGFDLLEEDPS